MSGATGAWSGEHLFLLLMKALPEKKQKLLDDFNKSLGFHTASVREWKHVTGLHCPQCGPNRKSEIVCNGRMTPGSARQRYLCRTCGASFNDHTNTVFHKSKKVEKWPAFLKCMLDGMSIRQSARDIGISPTTAQAWRLKILTHLAENMTSTLSGIVEYAEYNVKPSNKGQKTMHPFPPEQKETIVFCKSRIGEVCVFRGEDWKLTETPEKGGILWHTDLTESPYLPTRNSSQRCSAELKLLHTHHIAPVVQRFAKHFTNMRGVATKYLNYYAIWHQFLDQTNDIKAKEKIIRLLRLCL